MNDTVNNTDEATLLDAALNQSMGEVESAPEFITPPSGSYLVRVEDAKLEVFSWEDKKPNSPTFGDTKSAVKAKMQYSILETVELSDANAVAVPTGSLFGEDIGLEYNGTSPLKTYLEKFFGEEVAKFTFAEGVESLKGVEFNCIIRTKEKNGFENSRTSRQVPVGAEAAAE